MELLAETFEMLGGILIAFMAIRVHTRVREEHAIDESVFEAMLKERKLGILGILLIATGYLLQVYMYLSV